MLEKPLEEFSICIDPGHGGKDPGAVDDTKDDKIYSEESDIALKVATQFANELKFLGAKVIMTRTGDTYPTLGERCRIANTNNVDVFVSIHCNSFSPSSQGVETLFNPKSKEGKRLAGLMQQELVATRAVTRGIKERNDLYVLNGTKMPAVLVEVGFLSNVAEEAKLNIPAYQALIAKVMAKAILRYRKGESA